MTASQRLLDRLRQIGLQVPPGAVIARQNPSPGQRAQGTWRWRIHTADGKPVLEQPDGLFYAVGSTERVTDLVKAEHLVAQADLGDIHIDYENREKAVTTTPPCTVPDCGATERQQLSPSDGWVRAEISGFMQPRWFHNAACATLALQAAEEGVYFHAEARLRPGGDSWRVDVLHATKRDLMAVTDVDASGRDFPAASAGHRLVEQGYLVISAEIARPETLFGWTRSDTDSREWTTVCTPTP